MCELLVYPVYDHSSHKPIFFLGIASLFLSSLLLWMSGFPGKKLQFFELEISLLQANLIWHKKYFKTLKDMIIGTVGT